MPLAPAVQLVHEALELRHRDGHGAGRRLPLAQTCDAPIPLGGTLDVLPLLGLADPLRQAVGEDGLSCHPRVPLLSGATYGPAKHRLLPGGVVGREPDLVPEDFVHAGARHLGSGYLRPRLGRLHARAPAHAPPVERLDAHGLPARAVRTLAVGAALEPRVVVHELAPLRPAEPEVGGRATGERRKAVSSCVEL